MATKLNKSTPPDNHSLADFECFGPVATEDTKFSGCHLADLGCFKQDEGVDSNKYYHIAAVKSTKTSRWYAYFEWGRTRPDGRPDKPSFQFTECSSEQEAMTICEKQFHEKNTKRGVWEKIGSKDRYIPRTKKDGSTEDLYVVRPTATRLVGLPGAEKIANDDAKGVAAMAKAVAAKTNGGSAVKKTATPKRVVDPSTAKLFRDLLGGAVAYTKSVMSGGSGKATIPTQQAIDEGRELLQDALGRVAIIGDDHNTQINDRTLKLLTAQLYGRIPKAKPLGQAESVWILSSNNILVWQQDLDAFETALQADDMKIEREESTVDVMQGIPADVAALDIRSGAGEWLSKWLPTCKTDRNNLRGQHLQIHNVWKVDRHGDAAKFRTVQQQILAEMPKAWNNERPSHQIKTRADLSAIEQDLFWNTNTGLTIHGTRSVNVPGIVRESFRLPRELVGVAINGAMFGPGIYQADDWQKSANYCSGSGSHWAGDGGVRGRHSFMFLCDTICGVPHVSLKAHGFTGPPTGCHCVLGKAGKTESWGRVGGLLNNEWIVYRKDRTILRYLLEVSWK
jgi:hypothetical protein